MKKISFSLTFAFALSALLCSCNSEDTPSAYDGREPVLSYKDLPQGDHDYDQTIMSWYQTYNILTFYRFSENDYKWNVTSENTWSYNEKEDKTNGGYIVSPADESYVAQQLLLIKDNIWKHLPEKLITKLMQQKIFLASDIIHVPSSLNGKVDESQYEHESVLSGYDFFIFSYGNSQITTLNAADIKKFKSNAFSAIFKRGIGNDVLSCPEFGTISTYTDEYLNKGFEEQGFLTNYTPSIKYDLYMYVSTIVSNDYNTIKKKYLDNYPLIKKKYELVTSYFKEQYNLDLQSIGNNE